MPFKIRVSFCVPQIGTPDQRRFPSFLLLLYELILFTCTCKNTFSACCLSLEVTAPSLTVALFPFCSLLELVVTSLKTDPGWRSGAGGWRMLWGKSFFSKPMRWSSISKNWAIFKLIHSWKSNWHLCWWRCWNELTYLSIFPAFFSPFLTSSLLCLFPVIPLW